MKKTILATCLPALLNLGCASINFDVGDVIRPPIGCFKARLNNTSSYTCGYIKSTPDYKKLSFEVFYNTRARFTYQNDMEKWGISEHWESEQQIPGYLEKTPLIGDCDLFALAVRKYLRTVGIMDSRLIFCLTEDGIYHLVTEWQGWIFDNRYEHPVTKLHVNYKFLKISGYCDDDEWHVILK